MDPRTIKRILVPTDFSDPSSDALATAMSFAQLSGATLDVVHVAIDATYVLPPPIDLVRLPVDMSKVMAHIGEELSLEAARVRAAGISCESATLVGRPDAEIVTRARQTGAELIVMGTHGRSGLVHALLGSVAEKVIQHGPCPVLIVPKRADAA